MGDDPRDWGIIFVLTPQIISKPVELLLTYVAYSVNSEFQLWQNK